MNAPSKPSHFASPFGEPVTGEGDYAEAKQERVINLMDLDGACDPLDPSNFDEALSEALQEFPGQNLPQALAVAMREGQSVNAILLSMTNAYWEKKASLQADNEMAADKAYNEQDAYWLHD